MSLSEADTRAKLIDPAIHARVLQELERFAQEKMLLDWCGVVESPLLGPAGNKEFIVKLKRRA